MGADMLVATVWLAEGTTPDWPAAEKALADLTCPAEGFPAGSDLADTMTEDVILQEYNVKNATTDQERKKVLDENQRKGSEKERTIRFIPD